MVHVQSLLLGRCKLTIKALGIFRLLLRDLGALLDSSQIILDPLVEASGTEASSLGASIESTMVLAWHWNLKILQVRHIFPKFTAPC